MYSYHQDSACLYWWREPSAALKLPPMKKFFAMGAVLALLLFTVPLASPAQAQSGPAPVLVYYYAWWAPDAVGPGKSPDWPVNPYHSWDSAVIQQHVSQIASAGIDGMVVAWYGPQMENNQTETNFRMILDQAQASGTKALLSVDLGSASWFKNTQEVIDGLSYALSVHAQHPAYFRYNGKPVFFFWYQGRYSLSDWQVIRQQVDPDHNSIWIAEGAAPDALPTFDGLHMYTISWADNVAGTLSSWGSRTHSLGGLWVGTAMPGWDNTYTQQSEKYIRERQDGAFYRESFAGAAASSPNMILITSWNEWWEGTQIEPSNNYGDFYLNLTRDLITEYKASGAVSGGGSSGPPIPATAPPLGTQSSPAPGQGDGGSSPLVTTTPTSSEPTLPATITPTPATTVTLLSVPTLTATAYGVAEVPPTEGLDDQTGGRSPQITASSIDQSIAIGGAVAGALGLALIGAAFSAYRRTKRSG
jgi:hypothetical protein